MSTDAAQWTAIVAIYLTSGWCWTMAWLGIRRFTKSLGLVPYGGRCEAYAPILTHDATTGNMRAVDRCARCFLPKTTHKAGP